MLESQLVNEITSYLDKYKIRYSFHSPGRLESRRVEI